MSTAGAQPGQQRAGRILSALKRALWNKRSLAIVCVVAVVWVAGCGVIYSQMRKPPEQFGHFMTKIPAPVAFLAFPFETLWTRARAGRLNVGDRAPDFTLNKVDHSGQVQLSALNRTQPVVLIFGSYT
jgi:hypothetical protein